MSATPSPEKFPAGWRRKIARQESLEAFTFLFFIIILVLGLLAGWGLGWGAFLFLLFTVLLMLNRANALHLEGINRRQHGLEPITIRKAVIRKIAYFLPMAAPLSYQLLFHSDFGVIAFAGTIVVVFSLHTYCYPLLMVPAMERHKVKEQWLNEIAGDLMKLARESRCPVFVAERFLDIGDEDTDGPDLNAFACGFGHSKRIVIYSDLMDHYSDTAIRGVLAHEIAHIFLGHTFKKLALMIIPWGAYLVFLRATELSNLPLGIAVFLLLLIGIRKVSRRHEFAADRQAAFWVGAPTMQNTFDHFGEDFTPTRLDRLFSTHPSRAQRKAALIR